MDDAQDAQNSIDPSIKLSEWGFDEPNNGDSKGQEDNQATSAPKEPDATPAKEPAKPKEPEAKVKFTQPKADGGEPTGEGDGADPSEPEPSNLDEGQRANWRGLREAKEKALAKASQLEQTHLAATAELEGLKKNFEAYKTQHSEDTFKELQSKVQDYENKIRVLSVEDAPEVQAAKGEVSRLKESLATKLKAALPEMAGDVEALLSLPASARDAQINEALSKAEAGLPTATAINVALNELDKAGSAVSSAKAAAADAGANYQAQQEQAAAEAANQRALEQNAVLGEILQAAAHPDTGLPEFRLIDGNDEHNAKVKERMAAVRNTLTGDISFQDAATEAVFAQVGRESVTKEAAYQTTIANLTATVDTYKARIKELTGAEPGSGGTSNAGAGGSSKDDDFVAGVMSDMREAGF